MCDTSRSRPAIVMPVLAASMVNNIIPTNTVPVASPGTRL
jgi:hypothetical protein